MISGIPGRSASRAGGQALTPFQIAVLYLAFGLSLLVVSDVILPMLLSGPTLREIQGIKALVEVLASALLIYVLVAAAQERLRLKDRAMDEAPVGITIADARREDNPLVYVNAGFEEMTGYDESDCLGRNLRFLQGRNTGAEPVAEMRAAIDADRPVSVEVLNYREDGTPFWNQVSIVPVSDGSGTVAHYLGIQRDVTASTERKQRLAVLNRVLRHNMRNKLNVIRGRAEQLEVDASNGSATDSGADADEQTPERAASGVEDAPPPDRVAAAALETDAIAAIHDATDELLAIADQIRAFDASIDDGGDRSLHRVDIADLIRELVAETRERHPDASIAVEVPGSAVAGVHATFEPAVERLLHLLADAERPAATVAVRDEGGAVVVEIRDRGGALAPADLDVVAHGTETPLEHVLGLELWLVRWATEQSRGEFTVDTESDDPAVRLRFVRPDADSPTGEDTIA